MLLWSCNTENSYTSIKQNILLHFPYPNPKALLTTDSLFLISCDSLFSLMQLNALYTEQLDQFSNHRWNKSRTQERIQLFKHLRNNRVFYNKLQTDPGLYNLGGIIKKNLSQNTYSPEQKLDLLRYNLRKAPQLYLEANKCLSPDIEKELSQLAIRKQLKGLELLNGALQDSLASWPIEKAIRRTIQQEIYIARLSCKDYLAFCKSLFVN